MNFWPFPVTEPEVMMTAGISLDSGGHSFSGEEETHDDVRRLP